MKYKTHDKNIFDLKSVSIIAFNVVFMKIDNYNMKVIVHCRNGATLLPFQTDMHKHIEDLSNNMQAEKILVSYHPEKYLFMMCYVRTGV